MTKQNPQPTQGVKDLLGDPKKSLIKLAIPMVIAMTLQTLYNLVDAFWVSLLGADHLAAVGFVFPFFILIMAIGVGIGTGATSAISRRIGAQDKKGADNVADHSIILSIILAIATTIPLYLLAPSIFSALGAGPTVGPLATGYAQVIFLGIFFMILNNLGSSILRGEGDMKRAMYVLLLSSLINIILDPIFILPQFLNMGVVGAAIATVIALIFSCIPLIYWLIIKKDTYVTINVKAFRFKKDILIDILKVGLPASASQLSMSLMMFLINGIIILINTTNGVAIFSTGFRIATLAMMPTMGLMSALIAVAGATYGAQHYSKTSIVHLHGVKLGLIFEIIVAVFIFLCAPYIAAAFTLSADTQILYQGLVDFLRIWSFEFIAIPLGMLSSGLFQGVGKGNNALLVTINRAIILGPLFAYVLGALVFQDLNGIWWGVVIGNILGSTIAFVWARHYLKNLLKSHPQPQSIS